MPNKPFHNPQLLSDTPVYSLPMTLGLSVALLLIFLVTQLLGSALFASLLLPSREPLDFGERVLLGGENGTVTSLAVALTGVVVAMTIGLFIRAKGGKITEFLAIKGFRWRDFLLTGILLLLLNAVINGVGQWLERKPMVFMDKLVVTAEPFWLLVVAMAVIVPIYEELMFRGFMWTGLASSPLGVWRASVLTSVIFAMIHAQYGLVEWVEIFALAMLFSFARIRSGSLLLPISLHIINNSLAMAEYLAN